VRTGIIVVHKEKVPECLSLRQTEISIIQTHATSYIFYSLVKEEREGNLIENHTPFPMV
jgi:hypothetical protein